MTSAPFDSGSMHTLYEVRDLLIRAQTLIDEAEETLIAAQLSNVIHLVESRIGSVGERPH